MSDLLEEFVALFLTLACISLVIFGIYKLCTHQSRGHFSASINGQQVECNLGDAWDCGVHLAECKDGGEYYCVQNVKETK